MDAAAAKDKREADIYAARLLIPTLARRFQGLIDDTRAPNMTELCKYIFSLDLEVGDVVPTSEGI